MPTTETPIITTKTITLTSREKAVEITAVWSVKVANSSTADSIIKMNIELNDEFLSSNNNYYYLYKGKCMVTKEKLPGKLFHFNMTELSQFLFKGLHPFMSLMMD